MMDLCHLQLREDIGKNNIVPNTKEKLFYYVGDVNVVIIWPVIFKLYLFSVSEFHKIIL